jgi:GGDEF domain-containing protein
MPATKPINGHTLDTLVTFSIGIGKSYQAAAEALKLAKEGEKSSLYNIYANFGPSSERYMPPVNSNSQNFMRVYKHLRSTNADQEVISSLDQLTKDPKTELYNKLGFESKMLELSDLGKSEGYWILLDGNNMHEANDKKGYTGTDLCLTSSGKGILEAVLESTRSGEDRREGSRACLGRRRSDYTADIVAHRVNDSAGDEFLVYVPLKPSEENDAIVRSITMRILNNIYKKQGEALNNQYKSN